MKMNISTPESEPLEVYLDGTRMYTESEHHAGYRVYKQQSIADEATIRGLKAQLCHRVFNQQETIRVFNQQETIRGLKEYVKRIVAALNAPEGCDIVAHAKALRSENARMRETIRDDRRARDAARRQLRDIDLVLHRG